MTQVISGFGVVVTVKASNTLPFGYVLTQFSDDADAIDIPSLQIGSTAMGLNGDLLTWSKANPIVVNISLIPAGIDDITMGILLEANRVGKGKQGAQDIITLNIRYPNGNFDNFSNGFIIEGMPANSISNDGRMKTKVYSFNFENKVGI
jgi:hypothetical protein